MPWYRLAADGILIVHTAFIAFVIGALVATLIGWWLNWSWVRNGWFRAAHLLAIGYVIYEAWSGIPCPLTIWENDYRVLAGQDPYGEHGFIAYWLHKVIFFEAEPWVFTTCYTAFGLLVVAAMFLAPPRFRRARPLTPPAAT
jgi:hypothetical protein